MQTFVVFDRKGRSRKGETPSGYAPSPAGSLATKFGSESPSEKPQSRNNWLSTLWAGKRKSRGKNLYQKDTTNMRRYSTRKTRRNSPIDALGTTLLTCRRT